MISFTSLGGASGDYPNYEYYDDILEFDPSTGEWSLVDRMKNTREEHAVSVISYEKINLFC